MRLQGTAPAIAEHCGTSRRTVISVFIIKPASDLNNNLTIWTMPWTLGMNYSLWFMDHSLPLSKTVAFAMLSFVLDSKGNKFFSDHWYQLKWFQPLTCIAVNFLGNLLNVNKKFTFNEPCRNGVHRHGNISSCIFLFCVDSHHFQCWLVLSMDMIAVALVVHDTECHLVDVWKKLRSLWLNEQC